MIYKYIICTVVCILLFVVVKAQDTLILNDGTELYVKVTEIGEHTISYKKKDNITGPTYTTDIAKIFMAVYKNGKRETFTTASPVSKTLETSTPDTVTTLAVLHDNNFEVRLIETKAVPDKKKKYMIISTVVDAYTVGKLFTRIELTTQQVINSKVQGAKTITIIPVSDRVQKILWEKYESTSGKGYRWDLPADFFSLVTASCSLKFYQQKAGNKEILGFGGLSFTTLPLKDCSSLENKLLSVALVWLETNFEK